MNRQQLLIFFLFFLALLVLAVICLCCGAYKINFLEVPSILFHKKSGFEVLLYIRLPRVITCILVGAAIAISGVALQALLKNPLADAGLLGISTGSALGGALWLAVFTNFLSFSWGLPISAFIGGAATIYFVIALSKVEGKLTIITLILSGLASNAMIGSILGIVIFYSNDETLRSLTFWTMGDLGNSSWQIVTILLILVTIGIWLILPLGNTLNKMTLGDSEAFHLGVPIEKIRIRVIVGVLILVSSSVSFTGSISFIGLIVPHILRLCFGSDHRFLLPSSIIGGATLLLISDLISRTIAAPAEIPISILTSFIGAPFFIWLLLQQKRRLLNGI